MAKNTNKKNTARPAVRPQPAPRAAKPVAVKAATDPFQKRSTHLLIAGGIALITWLFLKVCLNNKLTNWDDPGYIRDNPLIKDISGEGLKTIFTTPVMGNYHPITI